MEFIDYYKTLEIDKKATQDDIKKAYRKLARKFHPDLNPNSASAKVDFQRINEANSVLSDPDKRKKYDEQGTDWQHRKESGKQAQPKYERSTASSANGSDFSDFFDAMFGGQSTQGRSVKYRGEDFRARLQLSLLAAYTTHQQTLNVNGKPIRITIPAGIENGQTIKINQHGGKGVNGGPNGDLYIEFAIDENANFKRLGNDLYTTQALDLYVAVLGGELLADTLNGRVKLKVKPETQNGEKVKLKGKGFPIYKRDGQFGDLYVTYDIKIPTGLTDKQKELFHALANA